ncbi:MAG: hypothetical protein DRI61_09080 [Chloroflexi bacterium]|nr:MAG: hypothetical protein DRI61_09080 [Chloroflexota bacterium]
MDTLSLTPNQAGYGFSDGDEVLSVKLDGGASRYRKDIANASKTVSVVWTLGPTDYATFRTFFRDTVSSGALPFLIDLLVETENLVTYKAYFVVGSVKSGQNSGKTFTVSAQLEIVEYTAP